MQRHEKLRRFKCPIDNCSKAFYRKSELKKHVRSKWHKDVCPEFVLDKINRQYPDTRQSTSKAIDESASTIAQPESEP